MSNEFDFDTKNGWKHYADAVSQEQMDVLATRYMDFLSHAKTERETVDLVVEALKVAGFSEDFKKDLVFRTFRNRWVSGKPRPITTAASANTSGWPGLSPCTA